MVQPQNYQCNLAGFFAVLCTSLQALTLPHNLSNVYTTSQYLCNLHRLPYDLLQLLHCSLSSHWWCVPPNILSGPHTAPAIFLSILSTLETSALSQHCPHKLAIMLIVLRLLIFVLIISPSSLLLMPRPSDAV